MTIAPESLAGEIERCIEVWIEEGGIKGYLEEGTDEVASQQFKNQ